MAASSEEAIPVKLPVPPSLPQKQKRDGHEKNADSVAARAIAALDDDDSPSLLDVHIRWIVESGSIVQKGEKIAQLFYSLHGTPPPPLGCASSTRSNNGNAIIRARTKKKRWATSAPSVETSNKMQSNQPNDDHFVSLAIKANADGFLRILYTKSFVYNAVQVNPMASPKCSVLNLILAAIEPCEHPAVVGGLCAVCGADTRAPKANVQLEDGILKNQHNHSANVEREGGKTNILRNDRVDVREQQIKENQKRLAASMASAKEFDTGDDVELASFDMDAAIASHANVSKQTSSSSAKNPSTVPKRSSTGMRSLSSLLSGAKATQKMQQIPPKQNQPPKQRPAAPRRVRHTAMSSSTFTNLSSNTSDPKMSKMTVSGGVTITISESEAKNISDASSKKLREEKKLALVLDLDHTLLHATDDYRAGRFVADEVFVNNDNNDNKEGNTNSDDKTKQGNKSKAKPNPETRMANAQKREDVRSILLPVELPPAQQQLYVQQKLQQQKLDETSFCLAPLPVQKQSPNNSIIMRHFIKIRPHLKEFFSQIESTYQLSIYTAGTRSYAEQVAVMICRHLVGATLDEEGLNALRAQVREKDEECRKYREYRGRIGRKRQLELLAKGEETLEGEECDVGMTADATNRGSSKSVTFEENAKGGKPETKMDDESGKSSRNSKSSNNQSSGAPAKINVLPAANDVECASSSSKKKSKPIANGNSNIPRKKPRVDSGSLLTLLPTETESSRKGEETEEAPLLNPSEERDRLRKELEGAEKLEIAAVELRRKIFGSRIVSRTDVGDLGKDVKSLKRVFPCGGVMAAILDDREDVWANAKDNVTGRKQEPPDNLLLVKPYHWKPFIGYADVNNASGNDLSKSNDVQHLSCEGMGGKEDDVQLLWTADILRRLHDRYYSIALSQEEREVTTVPSLLQSMRKETLLRFPQAKIVFSGLIPISKQNKQFEIRPQVVRYAEELGAEVLPGISPEATHVVAARDGSEKIKQARKEVPGCYVVHTSWLMECFWSISRRDVHPHHMGPLPKQQAVMGKKNACPKHGCSKDNVVMLLDSDEEESGGADSEDDFAADLEKEMMAKGK